MKTTLRSRLLTSLAVVLLGSTAMAQSPEPDGDQLDARPDREQRSDREGRPDREGRRGQRGGPPVEMMMRMMPVLAVLDADKDGTISESEIANASAALKTLDQNSDGKLTANELRPEMGAMRGRGDGGGPRGGGGEFLSR